jgi:hypothetical protein
MCVWVVARLVSLAADDQGAPARTRGRADRARRPVDADVHAVRRSGRLDLRRDRVRLRRMGLREEEAAVEERQLRRDDDIPRTDAPSVLRTHHARCAALDLRRPRQLELVDVAISDPRGRAFVPGAQLESRTRVGRRGHAWLPCSCRRAAA